MKKSIGLLLLFLYVTSAGFSQNLQINGVTATDFRGVNVILNSQKKAEGYYAYYMNERLKKGMREFMIEIYDLDLQLVKKTPVVLTKFTSLLGDGFNGNEFLFLFMDAKAKSNIYVTVDKQGDIIKKKTLKNEKGATTMSTAVHPSEDGVGFYITSQIKEKKWGYAVEKMDRELTSEWRVTKSNPKGITSIMSGIAENGKFVMVTTEKPTLMSKKMTGKVVSLNGEDGEILYEVNLFNGTITRIPSAFYIDDEGNFTMSGMYFDGMKFTATNSDGIYFTKISPGGEVLFENSLDWDNGIQKALKNTQKKVSIGSKPKVMFHTITQDADGNYQVIAETFRKTVRGGAVALNVLSAASGGGTGSSTGFSVMDLIVFNYDPEGNPLDIIKIEKPYKSITVPEGIARLGGMHISAFMKAAGMFTYSFIAESASEEGQERIVFINFEKPKGVGKGTPYLGVSTFEVDGDPLTSKIPLIKKFTGYLAGSRMGALLAKPGYACIYYHDRKQKAVNIMLEPLPDE